MVGRGLAVLLVLVLALASALELCAISAMEDDDFEDGTTMGWSEGAPSPNPPVNVASGGPLGVGDNYLSNVSSGSPGAGGRLAMFNQSQWTGDYNAVGSAFTIEADMANFGGSPLSIRIGIQDSSGNRYVSSSAVSLPADGTWNAVSFQLIDAAMTQVAGAGTLSQTLGDVIELRILSNAVANWQGAQVAASLGVDNFRVTSVPVELQSFTIE